MKNLYSSLATKINLFNLTQFKQLIFTTLILFGSFSNSYSASISGGDISYTCVGINQYEVTVKLYRDCDFDTLANSITLNYTSASCGVNAYTTLNRNSITDITPTCASATNSCNGGVVKGVELYVYKGLFTLPSGCSDWLLSYASCCRSLETTNISAPQSNSFYLEAELDNTVTPCNNSPVISSDPQLFACAGQTINYEQLAVDTYGDSLRYTLINARQSAVALVTYNPGFSGTNPFTSPAVIDIFTGQITFTPAVPQVAVLSVLIEEWRNGVKIGETMRDIQFIVSNCTNTAPSLSGVNGVSNVFQIDICEGQDICFDINSTDVDAGQNISLSAVNSIPGATFTQTGTGTAVSGTFCWNTNSNDIGSHVVVINAEDDACPYIGKNTQTYVINIIPNTNTSVLASSDITICEGETTSLSATTVPNGVSYEWTPINNLSNSTISNPIANPTINTTYTVALTYTDGCTSQSDVNVTVLNSALAGVLPKNVTACAGSIFTLTGTANQFGMTFEWFNSTGGSLGPGTVSGSESTISVTAPSTNGIYPYVFIVTNPSTGCQNTDTTYLTIGAASVLPSSFNIYASPTASAAGTGTKLDPTSLEQALSMTACHNAIIKMAKGIYNIDNPLYIGSHITLEGGFEPTQDWAKTSRIGATTINRTTNNPEGTINIDRRLVALYINSASFFRLQDLTIKTENAVNLGVSTYGILMNNSSDYNITRVAVEIGNATNGNPATIGFDGGNSYGIYLNSNGANGYIEHCFVLSGNPGTGGVGSSGTNGLPGNSANIFWDGIGTIPAAQEANYALYNQQIIWINGVSCTNSYIEFRDSSFLHPWSFATPQTIPIGLPGTSVTNWEYDAVGSNSNPVTGTFNPDSTTYNDIGRYNLIHNTCFGCPGSGGFSGTALEEYKGFVHIAFSQSIPPEISSTANEIGVDTFSLCVGDIATFDISDYTDMDYWSFGGAITDPGSITTVNAQFNITGFFEGFYRSTSDCYRTGPATLFYLNVKPQPVVSSSGNATICEGESTTLSIFGLTVIDSVFWSPNSNTTSITPGDLTVSPTTTTTYLATVYSLFGYGGQQIYSCPISLSYTVTVNSILQINMTMTEVICNDDGTATATPNTPGTYDFSWSNGYNEYSVSSSTITNLAAGTYLVTMTDPITGCSISDSIIVTPHVSTPQVSLLYNTIACFGASNAQAAVYTLNGTAPYSYNWTPLVAGGNTNSASPVTVVGLSSGAYTVDITDNIGCESSITFTIPENPELTVSVSNNSPICEGDTAVFTVIGNDGADFTYNLGAGNITTMLTPPSTVITIPNATTDQVMTLVSLDDGICSITPGTTSTVIVNPVVNVTDIQTTCSPYTWIDGNTYSTSNNTATYTLTNTSGCDSFITTLNLNFLEPIYAANNTSSNTYCTDASGWNHFYVNGDEIILSILGDLSGAAPGFPQVTIYDNGSFYQETQGPATAPGCASGLNPGEQRFEMERSYNVDFGSGTSSAPYSVKFYHEPAERTAIENAAVNWMATYPACGYTYKYPANPLGFYWFKNTGSNYTAPDYDGLHILGSNATSPNGINYAELTGITSFSGGSGAVILVPDVCVPDSTYETFQTTCDPNGWSIFIDPIHTNQYGCDSTHTYTIDYIPPTSSNVSLIACDSINIGGMVFTNDTMFSDTLTGVAVSGCDSILVYDLTINNSDSTFTLLTSCDLLFIGSVSTTFSNLVNCDSVNTIITTLLPTSFATEIVVGCDSAFVLGSWLSASTNFNDTLSGQAINGCDSITTFNVTINNLNANTDIQTACDSYTWTDGNTYIVSNSTATDTLTNIVGCDSIVTLNLTINNSSTNTDTQTACNTYTWIDGNTYTSSNSTAIDTVTNIAGCDSIVTLNLTINNSNTGIDTQTACDTYTWIDGNTYTASNSTAIDTVTNIAGCDSIVTLNLTINNSNTGIDTQTACDTYTWIDGNTYTASNTIAIDTVTNIAGCDSIVTLNLTINNSNTGIDTQTACDSYTWTDGNTYIVSNSTATDTLTNTVGCDSIVTLNLTINNSNTGIDTQTACETYTWIDGNTYTSSNSTAIDTVTNIAGCDSIVTLNLTINNSNTGIDTQTACDTYTWIDGNTYTASNSTAIDTVTNIAGCDSVVTLNLIINNYNTSIDYQVACDSYSWIDGNTYTLSNFSATQTLTNSVGCDSVVTLNLTINDSNSGIDVQSAVNTFSWIDGNTYTASNSTATHTLTNVAGCDSVVTLNLTITYTNSIVYIVQPPGSGTITVDGNNISTFPNMEIYNAGTSSGLIATPNPGFTFNNWDFDYHIAFPNSNSSNITVTWGADDTVYVNFNVIPTYDITYLVNPAGFGNIDIDGVNTTIFPTTINYLQGTNVNLEAFSNPNSTFEYWNANTIMLNPTLNNASVNFDAFTNDTIIANYDEYVLDTLWVIMNPTGVANLEVGTDFVTTSPFMGVYEVGELLYINALPTATNNFNQWNLSGSSLPDYNASTFFTFLSQDTLFAYFNKVLTIEDLGEDLAKVSIYPTVVNEQLNVEIISNENTTLSIDLINISGQKVAALYNGKVRRGEEIKETFDINTAQGVYFININSNKTNVTHKIIKLK